MSDLRNYLVLRGKKLDAVLDDAVDETLPERLVMAEIEAIKEFLAIPEPN